MPDFGDSMNADGSMDSGRYQYQGQRDPNDVALSPEAWAEYQKKRHRDAIFGILGTLGGMLGAQPLVNAMGIGEGAGALAGGGGTSASAGAATLPAAATEGIGFDAAPLVAGAGGAGAGASAAGFMGLSPRDIASLGLAGASTIGGALSNRNNSQNMAPNTQTTDPNLIKLIQTMQGRMDQSEPLYKSIMAMANGLLPTQYQNGGAGAK